MNKKNYIKLNHNNSHLSLGNIFRILKEESSNQSSALQTELFCIVFEIDDVSPTTVNNYCTGIRSIHSNFKNQYIQYRKKLEHDSSIFKEIILNLVYLLEENTKNAKNISFEQALGYINQSHKLETVCLRLYNIAKNESELSTSTLEEMKKRFDHHDLYFLMIQYLCFAIIDKKQPILLEDSVISSLNDALYSTNISSNDIIDFITIQLKGGIWSIRGIYELAKKGNPYACFEMGSLELYGQMTGSPRYFESYQYFKQAANKNHPNAIWAIGYLYYHGYIGTKSRKDLSTAFCYFNKARKLNCLAAFNSIGILFLEGNIPHLKKDSKKAIKLFEYAAKNSYIYAFNNLGKIAEEKKDFKKAFHYYLKAANLGESWASNRIGEFYRKGKIGKVNMKKALEYYQKATEASIYSLCYYAKYNLAHYFYIPGNIELSIKSDFSYAITLLEDASSHGIMEATEDLIFLYYKLYKENSDSSYLEKAKQYAKIVEALPNYNNMVKKRIETKLKEISITETTSSIQFE